MKPLGNETASAPDVAGGIHALKVFLLQATGARPRRCAYCGSTVAVGDVRCCGCGAAVTECSPEIGGNKPNDRPWLTPLLLCLVFPPAILVILPVLGWRWSRKSDRGWVIPILLCLAFPPAVLIVAPALLWRSPKKV